MLAKNGQLCAKAPERADQKVNDGKNCPSKEPQAVGGMT
jgi:hypothetical protein